MYEEETKRIKHVVLNAEDRQKQTTSNPPSASMVHVILEHEREQQSQPDFFLLSFMLSFSLATKLVHEVQPVLEVLT